MTHEELLAVLREARSCVMNCTHPHTESLLKRVNAALSSPQAARTEDAERQDSAKDVVESDGADGFYKDETHRLILEKNHILVQRTNVRCWYWSVNREIDGLSIGRGTAPTLAEAKAAAIAAAKGDE